MAYAQWITVSISPLNTGLTVKNVVHQWGKFYSGSKDQEVSPAAIEGVSVAAKDSYSISGCGRQDSASGTEGSFDLYDGDTHIGTMSWDCPWGSKTNSVDWAPSDDDNYLVQMSGANLYAGAIGNITLKVAKIS